MPLDAQDNKGDTALHIAVNGSRPQLCIDLIEVGANPFIKNKAGQDIPARIQSNLERKAKNKAAKEDQEKLLRIQEVIAKLPRVPAKDAP